MYKNRYFPIMLMTASVLAACNSMPANNAQLDEARGKYAAAQESPDVTRFAASELKDASIALDAANTAYSAREREEKVTTLSYVATQKIATTQEVAKRKAAEMAIVDAARQRDQVRLDQRGAEADRARNDATIAQRKTADAQAETLNAQQATANADARSRQLEAMLADMSAQKTERGMMVTLNDVLFNVDQAQLNPEGMRNVRKLADFMKQYPQRSVLIEGYTDSTGTSAHNQELSNRRAEAVRDALESMGVARDRDAVRGYGEAYPVASNDTAANRQLNRRVEIILSDDGGHVSPR